MILLGHSIMVCLTTLMIASANDQLDAKDPIVSYTSLDKPFGMQKLNLVWDKARVKLSESKLKLLHFELKVQDKEEVALKRLKADVGDKDGIREAEVRRKFNGILNHYGLGGEHEKGPEERKPNKRIFKDKKLDRLWEKAQMSGFKDEEMMLLKMEFQHYQDKVEEYSKMMEIAGRDPKHQNRRRNEIDSEEEFEDIFGADEDRYRHINALDETEMKKDLKRHYEKLHKLATNRAANQPFREPKVQGLWDLAKDADFNDKELADLKRGLHHYETRLQKLSHLRAEVELFDERGDNFNDEDNKTDVRKKMDKKIKRQSETVREVHKDLERMILARHSEL